MTAIRRPAWRLCRQAKAAGVVPSVSLPAAPGPRAIRNGRRAVPRDVRTTQPVVMLTLSGSTDSGSTPSSGSTRQMPPASVSLGRKRAL